MNRPSHLSSLALALFCITIGHTSATAQGMPQRFVGPLLDVTREQLVIVGDLGSFEDSFTAGVHRFIAPPGRPSLYQATLRMLADR